MIRGQFSFREFSQSNGVSLTTICERLPLFVVGFILRPKYQSVVDPDKDEGYSEELAATTAKTNRGRLI